MSTDLRTSYLGLELANPLVVAASPLGGEVSMLERLEAAGAGAAVLGSLFAEQIEADREGFCGAARFGSETPSSPGWACELSEYNAGPESYLRHIKAAKAAVRMPIIASLNATSMGDWLDFARLIQEVGADALELNIYFVPSDPGMSGAAIEDRCVELVREVRSKISIPLAVKIGPYFSSVPHIAQRIVDAGANGLVLFNRFLHTDIDLHALKVDARLSLSSSDELWLPLRWIGILRGQITASLAASTGIHTIEDVLKMILAGADVAMLASALLRRGPGHLTMLLEQLTAWLTGRGCSSLDEVRGLLSQHRCSTPGAFDRANYAAALTGFVS